MARPACKWQHRRESTSRPQQWQPRRRSTASAAPGPRRRHALVLAARSPVFRAMLLSPPAQAGAGAGRRVVRIDDTEPAAFRALLHFVYADALPATVDDDGGAGGVAAMRVTGEMLAAAGRYGVERMRALCERALRVAVADAATAAAALVIADRHCCAELRAFCVEYLASPEVLKKAVGTEWYCELKASRPVVLIEIFEKLAARPGVEDGNAKESTKKNGNAAAIAFPNSDYVFPSPFHSGFGFGRAY
ncbi:hypothetical protein ACP4OV_009846 [Aristida adscensionis]